MPAVSHSRELSTDVDYWTMLRASDRSPQDLMRQRRHVSFTENHEAKQVRDRISFRPLEVAVRQFPGDLLQVNHERRHRVRDGRTLRLEQHVPPQLSPGHMQRLLEFRGVAAKNLDEK